MSIELEYYLSFIEKFWLFFTLLNVVSAESLSLISFSALHPTFMHPMDGFGLFIESNLTICNGYFEDDLIMSMLDNVQHYGSIRSFKNVISSSFSPFISSFPTI